MTNRIFGVRVVLCLALAAGMLSTLKLWVSTRSFPLVPVTDALPPIPYPFDYAIFAALLALLVPIAGAQRPRKYIVCFLALAALLCLGDQLRWRPWFYQYLFMLAALAFYPWGRHIPEREQAVLNVFRLIVASVYFYSGLQKVQAGFVHDVFPWLIDPFVDLLPENVRPFVYWMGYVAPFVELGIGVGLLTRRFRRASVIFALLMHAFILLTLGPLGHNWGQSIWPWNVAMGAFVLILFLRTADLPFREIVLTKRFAFQKVILVLFVVMPLFSFFNLWDSYLSFSMYSGNVYRGHIYLREPVRDRLPADIRRHTLKTRVDGISALDLQKWAKHDYGAIVVPQERVYKRLTKTICAYAKGPRGVFLVAYEKSYLFGGDSSLLSGAHQKKTYSCRDL
jgi:hypothetical protein